VAADVALGKISVARAREAYGVVLDADRGMVDAAATAARRVELARA
jgi:hypothetical protein